MLFIGRTMNKETQLGREEKGKEKKKRRKKKRAIHRVAHITCGISRSSQNRFPCKCESISFSFFSFFFSSTGRALAPTSSLARKKKGEVKPLKQQ